MSEELKPCPFCGGPAQAGSFHEPAARCAPCGTAFLPLGMWNSRTPAEQPAPASTGREAELTEALRRLCTHEKRSSEQINRDWNHARALLAAPAAARKLDVEAEREACAAICHRLEAMMVQGGGETRPGERLAQAARLIRERAARSAAQGTAQKLVSVEDKLHALHAEADELGAALDRDIALYGSGGAPVSTEQAGDARHG